MGKVIKFALLTNRRRKAMKWQALKERAGAYEIRRSNSELFGGLVIGGNNKGVGFVGDAGNNRYLFTFEEGVFSKSVKVFRGTQENRVGVVRLGFTDTGTLETASGNYEWALLGDSKVWLDGAKNIVLVLDLEHNAATAPGVLCAPNLEPHAQELLILCGWYLTVLEYRAALASYTLAGMPAKIEEFRQATKSKVTTPGSGWFEVVVAGVGFAVSTVIDS
jgi:hypothetical protein